ncbi:MAG: hypothetical protein JJU22_11010 [Gammaproteobacteria bacterium]|jgi:hypothetical protein|nr:hypothetical protein [Gammaproteobacteria bacterium]
MAVSAIPLRVLSATLLTALLWGCGTDTEEAIVGKWEELEGPEVVEFDADGNVVLRYEDMAIEGRYEFLATDLILLDLRGPRVRSDPIEAPMNIEDDVLTLTMPDGRVATYGRAN